MAQTNKNGTRSTGNKSKSKKKQTGKAGAGTRKAVEKENKSSRGFLILILCLMLIMLAVFGGYALAGYIRNGGSGGKTTDKTGGSEYPEISGSADDSGRTDYKNSGNGADGTGHTEPEADDRTAVLSKTPSEIIFEVDPETGRIEQMLVGILRTGIAKLDYIRIDTDVAYTMSAGLYNALTPDNTTLPQTVTFSELYRYYNSDRAFDAGRRIVGEMLSFDIFYYSALTDGEFGKIFRIAEYSDGTVIGFTDSLSSMKEGYGTEGSMKGFIEERYGDSVTNWPSDQKLRYLDTWDLLSERDITFTDAPVIVRNESCSLDTDAVGRILYEILY